GFYSSTNLVYPDGTTNRFNTALATSCNLDSDNDGIVNCSDPTPIPEVFGPASVALAVQLVSSPALKAQISWNTVPYAANYVYYKNSFAATNWLVLTNFVSNPVGGRVSINDPVSPAQPRFYRVRVDPYHP